MAFIEISNFFQSKFLALSALINLFSCLACIASSLMPLWLILDVSVTFESQIVEQKVDVGIFFMDTQRFINLLMLDKSGENNVSPPLISAAQVLYLLGVTGMIVCTATGFILGFRRYTSPPGEMCLAGATTSIAFCLVAAVVCVVLDVFLMPDAPWTWMPLRDVDPNRLNFFRSVESVVPTAISLNYGFYIACFAAGLGIVGAVLIWLQACMTCSHTREKRYQMLRQDYDAEPPTKPGNPAYPVFSNVGYTRTTPGEVDL